MISDVINKKKPVAIIGAGSWGSTLALLLSNKGYKVVLGARNSEVVDEINSTHGSSKYLKGLVLPEIITATKHLRALVSESPVVIMAVPSFGFRSVMQEVGGCISGNQIVYHAVKGLEDDTYKRMSEIIAEESCCKKIGVLTGPNIAAEILQGQPTSALIASHFPEVLEVGLNLFEQAVFKIEQSHDVIGAEYGGVFKNVYAMAAGMLEELHLGFNTRAFMITLAMHEMMRLGLALGGKENTFLGLAGLGDLITTCSSPQSRNFKFGQALAQTHDVAKALQEVKSTVEGVKTLLIMKRLISLHQLKMPLAEGIYSIVYENAPFKNALIDALSFAKS